MTRKIMLVEITPPAVTALAYQIVADIPLAKVGVPVDGTLAAKGGAGNYSFIGASLPPGLSVGTDGKVTGTPTTAGFYEYTATVTDDAFASRTQTFAISIGSAVVVKAFFPAAEQGLAYSVTLLATGGTGPYTWSTLSGTLPAGLTRTGDTISGTPTTPGTYIFTIRGTDAGGKTGDYAAQMSVAAPVALAGTFPDSIVGVGYSVQLLASDGVPPYSYALTTGTLNGGLTLSATGVVSGVPAATESQALVFTVTDALGGTDTLSLTLDTVVPGGGSPGVTYTDTGIVVRGGSLQASAPAVGTTIADEVRGICTGTYAYVSQTWRLWVYTTPANATAFEVDVFLRAFGNTSPGPTDSICASARPILNGNGTIITATGSTSTWTGANFVRGDMIVVRPRTNTAAVKWWVLEIDARRTF